jgi:hypothetical protein
MNRIEGFVFIHPTIHGSSPWNMRHDVPRERREQMTPYNVCMIHSRPVRAMTGFVKITPVHRSPLFRDGRTNCQRDYVPDHAQQ